MYAEINSIKEVVIYPYTYDTLCKQNPFTSFLLNTDLVSLYSGTKENLNGNALVNVMINAKPEYNVLTQKCTLSENPQLINNVWLLNWVVENFTPQEQEEFNNEQKLNNKKKAENLLSATDWTQVADVPLLNKQAFIDYRATVRAIALNPPVQATFPDLPVEQWS